MALSLKVLKADTFTARLTYPDGSPLIIDNGEPVDVIVLGSLSWLEWNEAAEREQMPTPPVRKRMINGKQTSIEDKDDQSYKNAVAAYHDRIAMWRLAISMKKNGSSFYESVKGQTLAEVFEDLASSNRAIVEGLVKALIAHVTGSRVELNVKDEALAAAKKFHTVQGNGGEDFVPLESDTN